MFWRDWATSSVSRFRSENKKTVLIVNSQPREAAALQKQLAVAGSKTEIATTGEGAVKTLEARAPDIVLL